MTITHTHNFTTHVYEVVEEVPLGHLIWNIGHCAPEGYLPLCRPAWPQRWPGARDIEAETLKAIKAEGAQEILAAVSGGCHTLAQMEEYIEKHKNSKGSWEQLIVARCRKAIPYMKKINGVQYLRAW